MVRSTIGSDFNAPVMTSQRGGERERDSERERERERERLSIS